MPKKIDIRFTDAEYITINKMMKETNTDPDELIKSALALLYIYIEEKQAGNALASIDEALKKYKEPFVDAFQNIEVDEEKKKIKDSDSRLGASYSFKKS